MHTDYSIGMPYPSGYPTPPPQVPGTRHTLSTPWTDRCMWKHYLSLVVSNQEGNQPCPKMSTNGPRWGITMVNTKNLFKKIVKLTLFCRKLNFIFNNLLKSMRHCQFIHVERLHKTSSMTVISQCCHYHWSTSFWILLAQTGHQSSKLFTTDS